MSDAAARALGRKLAFYRGQRGLSQRDFGALIHRSETWVSQVERGVRQIDRMTVLRRVADALDVHVSELAADTPVVAAVSRRSEPAAALRMLLSSSLPLAQAVRPSSPSADIDELVAQVDRLWELVHAAAYDESTDLATDVITRLEAARRVVSGKSARRVSGALARAYHAAAAALSKLGEADAAWVAADRAIAAADASGDALLMAEGACRLTLVFQADRRYEQAEQAATTAVEALQDLVDAGQPAAIAIQGALLLQLAIVFARQNDASRAYASLDRARASADRLGVDRNDYNTEFGPTNVALHHVAVAVELGDAGTALRVASDTDMSHCSPERQARLHLDVARAQLQRRNVDAAVRALLDGECLAPEQIRRHGLVHNMLHDLIRSGHGREPQLHALVKRCGINPGRSA